MQPQASWDLLGPLRRREAHSLAHRSVAEYGPTWTSSYSLQMDNVSDRSCSNMLLAIWKGSRKNLCVWPFSFISFFERALHPAEGTILSFELVPNGQQALPFNAPGGLRTVFRYQLLSPSLSPSLCGTSDLFPLNATKLNQAGKVYNFCEQIQLVFERFTLQCVSRHDREFTIKLFLCCRVGGRRELNHNS